MKTPMWFVKAIAIDSAGKIVDQMLLTPPMSQEQALAYRAFAQGNNAGRLRWACDKELFKKPEAEQVVFTCFETTLY